MSATLTPEAEITELKSHNAELLAELELQRESNDKMQQRNAAAKALAETLEACIRELGLDPDQLVEEGTEGMVPYSVMKLKLEMDEQRIKELEEGEVALRARIAAQEDSTGYAAVRELNATNAKLNQQLENARNQLIHQEKELDRLGLRISELAQQNVELATESGLPQFAEELMDEAASCGRKFMDERNTGIMADFRIELGKLAEASRGAAEGLAFDAVCAARDVQRALFTSEVMSGCADDAREGRQLVLETRLLLCDHVLRMVANTRGFIDWQLAKPAPEARKV